MGISGLLPLLAPATIQMNCKDLKGSIAIVDTYCWLHRAAYQCASDLFHGRHTDIYVRNCISRVKYLRKLGVDCILVFDGQNLPSKMHTEASRHE